MGSRGWDVSEHVLAPYRELGTGLWAALLPNLQKNKAGPAGSKQLAVTPFCHSLRE